jgi:cytoplasmic iron level regulating protein YaaA (DUF328/UPF0246 family)
MKKVCLISCVKSKNEGKHKAIDLYCGQLYTGHLKYARSLGFKDEDIYILSAKHGLLKHDDVIEPYEKTLNNMKKPERNKWAKIVLEQLKNSFDVHSTEFTILAGKNYYENLEPYLPMVNLPPELKGLPIGKRVQKLNQLVAIE